MYAKKKNKTAYLRPMWQKKKKTHLKWFSHKHRTRKVFFPPEFYSLLFYKIILSHICIYSYISSVPQPIDIFGQIRFFTIHSTLAARFPPPPTSHGICAMFPRGGRSVYVWAFGPWVCRESVRKKGVVKWGCLATPPQLTSVRETDHRGSIRHVQMAQCVLWD